MCKTKRVEDMIICLNELKGYSLRSRLVFFLGLVKVKLCQV
jgi:hypothetical protein